MAFPKSPLTRDDLDRTPTRSGNLPGTINSGLIFLEYVNIERKIASVWTAVVSNLPATFEPISTDRRLKLETWTHKPIFCVWLPPDAPIQDGDRIIRCDGSHWYLRGAAIASPDRTHIALVAEAATEDNLFAARTASEPP